MIITIESLYTNKEEIIKEIGNQILNLQKMEVNQVVDSTINNDSDNTISIDDYKELIDKQWDKKPIYEKSEVKERIQKFRQLRDQIKAYDTDDINKLKDIINLNNELNAEKMELNNVIDCIYDALGLNSSLTKIDAINSVIGEQIRVMQNLEMFSVNDSNIEQYKGILEKQWITDSLYKKDEIITKKEKYSKLRMKLNNFNGDQEDLEEIVNLFNELSSNKLIYENGVLRRGTFTIDEPELDRRIPDPDNNPDNNPDSQDDSSDSNPDEDPEQEEELDEKKDPDKEQELDEDLDPELDEDLGNEKDGPGTAIIPVKPQLPVKRDKNEIVLVNPNPIVPQPQKRRRVVSSVKKYVSTHKKAILIGIAITTLLLVLPHVYPVLATSVMSQNAALWHMAPKGLQGLLHGVNVGLAKTLELLGMSSSFTPTTGVWTVGDVKGIGSAFLSTLGGEGVKTAILGVLGGGAYKLVKDKLPETISVGEEKENKLVTEKELEDYMTQKRTGKYHSVKRKIKNVVDEKTNQQIKEEIYKFEGLEKVSLLTALKEKFRKKKEKREKEQEQPVSEYEALLSEIYTGLENAVTYEEFEQLVNSYDERVENFTAEGKSADEIARIKNNLRVNFDSKVFLESQKFANQMVVHTKNQYTEEFQNVESLEDLRGIFAKYKGEISDNPHFTNEEKKELFMDLKEKLLITKKELDDAKKKTDGKSM